MKIEELEKLLQVVADTGVQSLEYEENGVKISIQGRRTETVQVMPALPTVQATAGMEAVHSMQPAAMPYGATAPMPFAGDAMPVQSGTEEKGTTANADTDEIQSPLVGVFYAAPAEDAEPFVKVGDTVHAGQTIAIVEAMKLMNEIEAETDGVIKEVLVKNAQAVEFGQPLFRILPA